MGRAYLLPPRDGTPDVKQQYLYNAGDEHTDITGGWQARAHPRTAPSAAKYSVGVEPTLDKSDSAMTVTFSAPDTSAGAIETARNIDLAGYKRIGITYSLQSGTDCLAYMGAYPRYSAYFAEQLVASKLLGGSGQNHNNVTAYMDITAAAGAYDIGINVHSADETLTMSITKIWLEG